MNIYQERYSPVLAAENGFVAFQPVDFEGRSLAQLIGRPLPVGVNGAWIMSMDAPWLWRLDKSSNTGFAGQSFITPALQLIRLSNFEQLEGIRISGTTKVYLQFFRGGVPGTTE